jgi:nucleotide-binding universal stress UspA family protein
MREVTAMSATRAARVVVGVDDSLSGLEALRFAAAEARRRGVGLRAVRAWQVTARWLEPDVAQYRAATAAVAAMVLQGAFQQAMGGPPHDITVEALVAEGPPARVLVEQAGAVGDLLVLGRPGRGRGMRDRLRRAWHRLTGRPRVTVHCVRDAVCPVVTVGAPELARDVGAGPARNVVSAAEALLRDAAAGRPSGRPPQPA